MKQYIVDDGIKKKWCPICKNYWAMPAFRKDNMRCRKCDKKRKLDKRAQSAKRRRIKKTKQMRRARQAGATVFVISVKDMTKLLRKGCRYESDECKGYLTLEHIIPLSRGGTHGIGNLTRLCIHHNVKKGSKLHVEYIKYQ